MSLRDTIRNATASVVPRTLAELAGSTVTTTRYAVTKDIAARPSHTPSNPITGAQWYIHEIAQGHAQRVYGETTSATAEAQVPLTTNVQAGDVVKVTAGDYVGAVYEIEQIRRDPLGNRTLVALGATGKKSSV